MFRTNFPHGFLLVPILILSSVMTLTTCSSRQAAIARQSNAPSSSVAVKINSADARELEKLPGIGPALAAKIVDHRDRYGPFRKPEHLLMIDGISDERFRKLRGHVTVE